MAKSPKARTEFEDLFEQLVETERELRAAGDRPKLSAVAFAATAIRNAATDSKRLDALEARFADPSFGGELSQFILRLVRDVCLDPNYGAPPKNGNRLTTAYGRETTHAILAQAGSNALEALALAARLAAERSPDRFGTVADMDAFRAREQELRSNRARLIEAIQRADIGPHVIIETDRIGAAERDAGLCRVRFRDYPVLLTPDWIAALLTAVIAPPEPQEEPPPWPRPLTPVPVEEDLYA